MAANSPRDPAAFNYIPQDTFACCFNKSRGGVPQWKNEVAVMSYGPWLDLDPISNASAIKIPALLARSDGCPS